MKRYLLILMSMTLLAACVRENITEPNEAIVFKAGFEEATETKTHLNESLQNRWDADDRVSIFVGNTYNQQFKFDGATGDDSGSFSSVGNPAFVSGSRLSMNLSVYPYRSDTSVSEDGTVSFMFPAEQEYSPGSYGIGANTMVAVTENTSDNFLLFKNTCGSLKVTLYGDATITSITLQGNAGEKIAGLGTISASFLTDPEVSMSSSATDLITLNCGEGVQIGATSETATDFYFVVPPVEFGHGFTIKAMSADGTSFTKSTEKSVTITRNIIQRMASLGYEPNGIGMYEYVDLGLSVKWATMNVGASKPEELGDYFAWGEVEPHYEPGYAQEDPQRHWKPGYSGYDQSEYKFYSSAPINEGGFEFAAKGYTKYVPESEANNYGYNGFFDDKTVLDPEDDAAHVNWGGKWRMPTDKEWGELRNTDNCTWTWGSINGVYGYRVASKKPGYTSKWIFVPAAGYGDDSCLSNVGSLGVYWSSSLYTNYPGIAYQVFFDSDGVYSEGGDRYYGFSVRPVYSDDPSAGITGISLDRTSADLVAGEELTLVTTVSSTANAVNKYVQWSSSDTSVATVDASGKVTAVSAGTATITAKTVFGGFTATCTVTVTSPTPTYEYVDLGLSVKWATMNVGATRPEDYGDYFAWGATETWYEPGYAQEDPQQHWKNGYSYGYTYKNTPYQTEDTTYDASTKWTKYLGNTSSSYKDASATDADALKTVLDPEDDAAHVNWSGSWRMPTDEEWNELINNCTWTWTSVNGVKGYKVTSNKSGYTDRWIFLPAAGFRDYGYLFNVGSNCRYWSSSMRTGYPYLAFCVYFSSGHVSRYNDDRCYGLSVRPVYTNDPSAGITGISLDRTSADLAAGEELTLVTTVSSTANAVNKYVQWSSSDTSVATVDASGKVTAVSAGITTITAKTVFGGFTATCTVTVTSPTPTYEYVDLGLSVKWATMNVGATRPEEYGDYFAWGATEPWYEPGYAQENPQQHWKSGYSDGYTYANAPYQTVNTTGYASTKWTKYLGSTTSSYKDALASDADALKTVLDPEDDAAHVNWSGSWRMPTDEEWTELRNYCTWTGTSVGGVNGHKVQSKKPGYTDKWIFLPDAGRRNDGGLYNVGSYGYYWSSSLSTGYPYLAFCVYFSSGHVSRYNDDRSYGLSVRPVYTDDPSAGITGISLGRTSADLAAGEELTLVTTVSSTANAVNKYVQWSSSDTSVATVDASGKVTAVSAGITTITAKTVFGGFTATCTVTVTSPTPTYEYVDLGLSVKWATMNVGASKPEELGDYFAWGATEPWYEPGYAQENPQQHWKNGYSDGYTWKNAPYQTVNTIDYASTKWTKYLGSTTSSYKDALASDADALKTVLDPEDDAAHVNWGGSWRMPTDEEWTELRNYCTWTWTSAGGVNGHKVQSKKPGYTDKWIFLPAAGYGSDSSRYDVGSDGNYWSSSLYTGSPVSAYCVYFNSDSVYKSSCGRYYGQSVRPVTE